MSGRALLAIGCNVYDYLDQLTGAEADADAIFKLLIEPKIGDYDVARSHMLLSPTLQQVREALAAMIFDGDGLDTLTITFAGHGAVSSGSFYMAMQDSRLQALSATALSLADLFRMIAEAAPKQTYLIIDACQSGGLISDLNVILKSEIMGEFGTPGVTLLATAASNENAIENNGHGIGTGALLDCIRGELFIQDSNPALDLVEIGRAVSERVSAVDAQTPVVWGLNLYGPSSFCKNPHVGTGNAPLRSVLVGWPDANTAAAIRVGLPLLWGPYVAIPTRWEPREFLDRLASLIKPLKHEPTILINLVQRVSDACAARAQESSDPFREVEVRATCVVALLPYLGESGIIEAMNTHCIDIANLVEQANSDVIKAIDGYQYALVIGGLGDLYYLPIRLTKLIGWAGFAVHARHFMGLDTKDTAGQLASLLERIFETYSLSLVAMSDCQAPYIISAMTACARVGLQDAGERFLGHMFSSSIDCGGQVARCDLDASKVLGFLVARGSQPALQALESLAQPTELVLALLRLSLLFDLADEFDTSLLALDHLSLNAYLPDDYRQFGDDFISGGINALFRVGHDFWTIAQLEAAWPNSPAPEQPGTVMTALLASLLFPDRSPWFLLPRLSLIEAQTYLPAVDGKPS
jgi:hypothetical protein